MESGASATPALSRLENGVATNTSAVTLTGNRPSPPPRPPPHWSTAMCPSSRCAPTLRCALSGAPPSPLPPLLPSSPLALLLPSWSPRSRSNIRQKSGWIASQYAPLERGSVRHFIPPTGPRLSDLTFPAPKHSVHVVLRHMTRAGCPILEGGCRDRCPIRSRGGFLG